MRFKKDYIVIHSYLSIFNNPMIMQISNVLANVGKNGLHTERRFRGWVVRGGTINSQIVKQEGEYTPEVPDTVTHVPLRTHAPSSSSLSSSFPP